MQIKRYIADFVKQEFIVVIFLALLVLLSVFFPVHVTEFPAMVDWDTIRLLTGLLILATGIKESGYFDVISQRILKKIGNERTLAIFLTFFSVILSTFLTNDIALFIIVPITLGLRNLIRIDISKLIIFEAIAVNAGSALSPIGNPQNIFLWQKWSISFMNFIVEMTPSVIVLLISLLLFLYFIFPAKKIRFSDHHNTELAMNKTLLWFSGLMMIIFLLSVEIQKETEVLIFIMVFYLISYRKVLKKTDWLLLFLFILVFIDFHIISTLPFVSEGISFLKPDNAGDVFIFSGIISQFISNVPASVFVSKFSTEWQAIAYGVNIGGNGLVIGSLANIIALRMTKSKKIWIDFHKYSIPYFLFTATVIYFLIY